MIQNKEQFDTLPDASTKLAAWHEVSKELARVKALEASIRKDAFGLYFRHAKGTETFELGNGYKVKGVATINYKLDHKPVEGGGDTPLDKAIDAIEKMGNDGPFIAERLVIWKPELSVGEYGKLADDSPIKKLIDGVLTTSEGMPSLEIIEPKAKA